MRATLIPATTYLLGERAWYLPRWLDRLPPDVDVEVKRLEDQADDAAAEKTVQEPSRKRLDAASG